MLVLQQSRMTDFDGPCSEQRLPVGFSGWDRERRWEGDDICSLSLEREADLGKSQLYIVS